MNGVPRTLCPFKLNLERASFLAATNCSHNAFARALIRASSVSCPTSRYRQSPVQGQLWWWTVLRNDVALPCPSPTRHHITALLIRLPRFCQALPGVQSCFLSSEHWLIVSWLSGLYPEQRGAWISYYRLQTQRPAYGCYIVTLAQRFQILQCFREIHIVCSPWVGCHMLTKKDKKQKTYACGIQPTGYLHTKMYILLNCLSSTLVLYI